MELIMAQFIIKWDAGYGYSYLEVEADSAEEAMQHAYEEWKAEAENNADYDVVGEATDDLRDDYL